MARSRRVLAVWVVALAVAVAVVVWRLDDRGADDDRSATAAAGAAGRTSAPRDNGVTNGDGTEVIRRPEGSEASGSGPTGLRPTESTSTGSLVKTPLPRTASREGALVAGFPASVVPVLPGSAVDSSGVSSTSGAVQVSIVANSPRSRDAVLAFYRRQLGAQGFAESVVPASAGSVGAGFERGTDHLVVTTTATGKKTTYSLFGTLHSRAHD